jgi:hypothetical protein
MGPAQQKKAQPDLLRLLDPLKDYRLPAVPSAAAPTIVSPAATASAIPLSHGLRLVHGEAAPAELRAIQVVDGLLCLASGAHFDEPETARLSGKLIRDNPRRFHRTVSREKLLQLRVGNGIRQTANV